MSKKVMGPLPKNNRTKALKDHALTGIYFVKVLKIREIEIRDLEMPNRTKPEFGLKGVSKDIDHWAFPAFRRVRLYAHTARALITSRYPCLPQAGAAILNAKQPYL